MLSLILLTIAGVFSSFSQIANKKLAKPAYSSESLTTAQMLLNALIALPLLFYRFDVPSDFKYWALTLLSTLSFAFSTKYFFKALQLADVSLVSILYKLNIVFVVIIGIALLKESYTIIQSIGLILIIFSSIFVIYKGSIIKSVNLSIIYVLAACMFTTFSSIADKIVLNHFSPFTYVFVNNLLIGELSDISRWFFAQFGSQKSRN